MPRGTLAGQLAAMGFADTARAQQLLAGLGIDTAAGDPEDGSPDRPLLQALASAADPDLALAGLSRIAPDTELRRALRTDAGLRDRLISVLGASAALGDHLARHPGDWRLLAEDTPFPAKSGSGDLRADLLAAVGAGGGQDAAGAAGGPGPVADLALVDGRDPATRLRIAYRRRLLQLAARDLTGADPLEDTMAGLADLTTAALDAALAIARADLPPGSAPARLAVIAMGKCGARELNYASDVDVIFVAGGTGDDTASPDVAALRTATALASGLIRVCTQSTPEGPLFPVDANLRPEGRDGPLVRTVASHKAYYERWAKTWEFQALLKARFAAGDAELGAQYLAAVTPFVWQAAQRDGFVADVQAMRRRVVASLPAAEAGRELKLGPGGLRDIEFAVQLLQLVHGRADESLRDPATLRALSALAAGGYVGRADAAAMASAYRFLRRVEHLVQLRQLRRTHRLPEDPRILREIGRALIRMQTDPAEALARSGDPAAALAAQWRLHASQARQLHEKLFYRPLLDAVARLPGEATRLTPEAARDRLEALGFADPAGALRHIESLTAGMSRKAAMQRTLLPVLLGWLADAPEPDAGLLAFRQVSEALGGSPWYLRLLRDNAVVARRMARLLASSRYATGLLLRAPEAVAMLGDDAQLTGRPAAELLAEAASATRRHDNAADAARAVLAIRRRELLRTAAADVLGLAGIEATGAALTTVAQVTIAATLRAAVADAERASGPLPTRVAVIAMGRLGGHEMSYSSDADVLFVHDPVPGASDEAATRAAHALAEHVRALLSRPGPDPALVIDAGLRPEGRQGPLVRTLASYRAYYRRWSVAWEAQALLRAEFVAGDSDVGAAFMTMADEIRYPDGGIDQAAIREIRRIKARMEAERMPRGVEPGLHLKLGPGGLADVEWVAQLLQLRHARAIPELRTTRTPAALAAATAAGLISAADTRTLTAAWLLASRIRDAVMLVRGRPSDTLPTSPVDLAVVARVLGYPPDGSQDLAQDWRRSARQARAVMERIFYG
ncbi:MAG TPA: bifunctional [glutamine synthetase] adenylyltransferase/[glutamine synthetase]-adenylyl-L-tyrosine phosphorylase [Streptosporangiaceae bacterium]|jgi:glutamate-ammonia-ligase adenylyltransferase|nr:bifunctional [glutamine synthetase] adenylyltransferase/[glutamine synthetase]-adenylyl-L-tyrosine phosphorylase [Streptosporangiaceae bacterium]